MAYSTNLRVQIKVPQGETIERVFDLHSVTIGRSSSCNLPIQKEGFSRKHCLIELVGGEFFVTDLGSTNGVFIQGEKLTPHKRTPFNNFMPLHLAEYECLVSEVDPTVIRKNPIPALNTLAGQYTTRSRKIDLKSLSTADTPVKISKKKNKTTPMPMLLSIVIGLFVIFLGIDQFMTEKEKAAPTTGAAPAPRPKVAPPAENDFLSEQEYIQIGSTRACESKTYCDNLHIKVEMGESLKKIKNEFMVFYKPSLRIGEPKYQTLSSNEEDLIAFDQILTSLLLEDFLAGKVDQIHLILLGQNEQIKKVFRFHPQLFSYKTVSRQELFPLLSEAIKTKNPLPFWERILVNTPVLDLSNK